MKLLYAMLSLALTLTWVTPVVYANTAQAIQARMKARLNDINSLKNKGLVGENNKGFLTVLPQKTLSATEQTTIEAENKDRQKVYQAIAQKQGVSSEIVGERRAAQIRAKADKGHAVQQPDGKWTTL